ncbi:MAG TPA: hypothetical protein DCG44_01060 [Candidatus Aquiluna sp.]|nr:hypothetical protein [Aquiluna sp.]
MHIPVRIVHGTEDDEVPMSQSNSYVKAAKRTGQDVRLERVKADHYVLIEPGTAAWAATLAAIVDLTA